MANNQQQNIALDLPLVFTGEKRSGIPGDHRPADFVRELLNRKSKHAWSDLTTMGMAKSAFKGEAATWYFDNLATMLSPVEFSRYDNSWTAFQPVFNKKFGLAQTKEIVELSQLSAQKPSETVDQFMVRVTR